MENLIQLPTDTPVGVGGRSGIDLPGRRFARPDKLTAGFGALLYSRLEFRVDNRSVEGKYLKQRDIQSIGALDGDIGTRFQVNGLAEGQSLRRG